MPDEVIPPRDVGSYLLSDGWVHGPAVEVSPPRDVGSYLLSDGWSHAPATEITPARPVGSYLIVTVLEPYGWGVGAWTGTPAEWSATVIV